jgi:hypothetical protein
MGWRLVRIWVGAVLLATGLGVVAPAWACGCGGYMPDALSANATERARVAGEKALVRFDGGREEIVLSMAVRGESRKAAWIMPVPSAAEVELGETGVFRQLESATRPKVVYRNTYWPFRDLGIMGGAGDPAAAAPQGGVDVRQQMVIGPFQVVRLGATDPAAVTKWLATNGFVVPPGLAANLAPYVTEKWEIVAVRLAPKGESERLRGQTPPLRLSFASERLVYPMRLSKGATTAQTVTVYVAAPYRVEPTTLPDPDIQPELLYAGRAQTGIDQLDGATSYLTAYSVQYQSPERISADFVFERASTDEEFRRIVYVTRNEGFLSTVAFLLAAAPLTALVVVLLVRRFDGGV